MFYDSETVSFHKLSRSAKKNGFKYATRDASPQDLSYMGIRFPDGVFTICLQILNFTAEDVILCANHNSSPTIVPTMQAFHSDKRSVFVKIAYSQLQRNSKTNHLEYVPKYTEIEVMENTLRESIVFIDEIDTYLSFKSNFSVIRDQIKDDSLSSDKLDTRIVSLANIKADPALVYERYKVMTETFLTRHERIRIYTGNPEKMKDIRISIWDSYFHPFLYERLIYDPTLKDGFVIALDRGYGQDDIKVSFDHLSANGIIYVDPNEKETILGTFHGMVVFNTEKDLSRYFHERKAKQRYENENRYLSEHSGNLRLQSQLSDKDRDLELLRTKIEMADSKIVDLGRIKKDLSNDKKFLEKQIEDLVDGGIVNRSAAIISKKLKIDESKADNDLYEMAYKERVNKANAKVNIFKNIGDIFKTVFSIVTTVIAIAPIIVKGFKVVRG